MHVCRTVYMRGKYACVVTYMHEYCMLCLRSTAQDLPQREREGLCVFLGRQQEVVGGAPAINGQLSGLSFHLTHFSCRGIHLLPIAMDTSDSFHIHHHLGGCGTIKRHRERRQDR